MIGLAGIFIFALFSVVFVCSFAAVAHEKKGEDFPVGFFDFTPEPETEPELELVC